VISPICRLVVIEPGLVDEEIIVVGARCLVFRLA
jgi:hypothetical protein